MSVAINSEHRNNPTSLSITVFMAFAASLEQIPYKKEWAYTAGYWDNIFKDEDVQKLPKGIYSFYTHDDRTALYFRAGDGTSFVIAQRYSHYCASSEVLVATAKKLRIAYPTTHEFVKLPLQQIQELLDSGFQAIQDCFDKLNAEC